MPLTPEEISDRMQARIGTVVLLSASVMAVLIFCDRTGVLPFTLPRYWYSSRQMHVVFCALLLFIAAILLRTRVGIGPLFSSCQVMTRQYCPLCDEAIAELMLQRRYLPPLELVDIDLDPVLQERWGEWVPVVVIDGRVRFRGTVNPILLQRLIDAGLERRTRGTQAAANSSLVEE